MIKGVKSFAYSIAFKICMPGETPTVRICGNCSANAWPLK
jgi:hypothetical protein